LPIEDSVMNAILASGLDPSQAAQDWLKSNQAAWAPWLVGVTTFDGKPAEPVLAADLSK
jgi:glycine betaine/proline transport system substrate-binding protein